MQAELKSLIEPTVRHSLMVCGYTYGTKVMMFWPYITTPASQNLHIIFIPNTALLLGLEK